MLLPALGFPAREGHGAVAVSPEEPSRVIRGWSSSAVGEAWQNWDCSPGEEELQGDPTVAFQDLREPTERWGETLYKGLE